LTNVLILQSIWLLGFIHPELQNAFPAPCCVKKQKGAIFASYQSKKYLKKKDKIYLNILLFRSSN